MWRDTKAALVLFVKQANVTEIVEKAETVLKTHDRFKRQVLTVASSPVYVLHHEGDPRREIQVALVTVPIPPLAPHPGAGRSEGE